jgi:flagellin-like hook-associated protein FlgL
MAFSIQTNVASMSAQENLRVNQNFQSQTIQRLTSGYRINQSGDDAAGLAIANKFRADVAELTQGVRNANDGLSQLQIIDGGTTNIAKILDRMKTLATQSASTTFTGSRATLNNEFATLKAEIDRQATNVGLNSGGTYNSKIGVYIGGGVGQSNASVTVDLSGTANAVDSTSLGISSSATIDQGLKGVVTAGDVINTLDATDTSTKDLTGGKQDFKVTVGGKTQATVTIDGGSTGLTAQQAIDQLNGKLASYGITASISSGDTVTPANNGRLQFNSTGSFVISAQAGTLGTELATGAATSVATNAALYNKSSAFSAAGVAGGGQVLDFTVGGAVTSVSLVDNDLLSDAVSKINAKMNSQGVYAMDDGNGKLSLQSVNQFTLAETGGSATAGLTLNGAAFNGAPLTITGPDNTLNSDPTTQAKLALTAISNATSNLSSIQGRLGAGQNQLGYAISLAQSQITNFSAAESRIRDTDVAAEAANLTKAQVLQQARWRPWRRPTPPRKRYSRCSVDNLR